MEETGLEQQRSYWIRQGLLKVFPVVIGYCPIGFAFGVLAAAAGISLPEATAMSLLVYAGSSQFIAVNLLATSASLPTLLLTTFLVNLRHLLMSASMAPYLRHLNVWQQAAFCFELTDETFAVHSMEVKKQPVMPWPQLLATNLAAHLAWVGSTFLGAWAGLSIPFDSSALGLDYALPAMFIALLVMQLTGSRQLAVALLAASLSTALYMLGVGHWSIILAAMAGATAGVFGDGGGKRRENS